MNPERWQQVEALYNSALEREPEHRGAYLSDACGADAGLRRDVEALLEQGDGMDSPLEKPVLDSRQFGPYAIISKLGAGGMGEVHKAFDTRLNRTVAIKVLKAPFTDRFQREARAIAALNHPHVCTLYDIGAQDGASYLVMEYVEGEPLKGPLPIADALRLAIQIASALEAAHEKGILHRDLKPGNILVAKSGVKLLDFGLAKFAPSVARPMDVTVTAPLTGTGQVLGTPAYMSPEQIEGTAADVRSDIFSFGLVLYEMITGLRAFRSSSQNGLMAAILKEEPTPITMLQPSTPAALDRTVRKCLAKNPAHRWQTAAEIRHELESIGDSAVSRTAPRHVAFRWVAGAAVLASLFAGYLYLHRSPRLTDKDTIVLADFTNTTGDSVFDGTLRQGLAVQLGQSPFLSMISDDRLRQTLRMMDRPADTRLTPEVAREICERTGSAAVLVGSIAPIGSQYVLGFRAANCRSGEILDEEQVQAAKKEDVLNALSQIAANFRKRAGESLATIEKYSTPLAEATTPSLEAWKAFAMGWKIQMSQGHSAALPFFKRATEIDPKFATAYAWLGRMYGSIGEFSLTVENTSKAWQFRDRASDQERFYIDFSYYRSVKGDLEKAGQICEMWARTYPRDVRPHSFLGSSTSTELGKFERAEEEGKKAIEMDPYHPYPYGNLATLFIFLGRLAEARSALQLAVDRKVDLPEFSSVRYQMAFLNGDQAEMKRLALSGEGSDINDWFYDLEAAALAYYGQLQQARTMSRRAVDTARQAQHVEAAAQHEAGAAVREVLFGNAKEARQAALSAEALSHGRDAEYGAAIALALAGDSTQSQKLSNDLEKRFPEHTTVKFSYLPVLHALVALNRHDPLAAIAFLQPAAPYELGWQGSASVGFVGSLYPIYVRGVAFLAARRGAQAAIEFQKLLDHRGIVLTDPIGAVARLQLGRAFALTRDKHKAITAYQDFLTLWKNADPDIPILKQAKAEYASLQ